MMLRGSSQFKSSNIGGIINLGQSTAYLSFNLVQKLEIFFGISTLIKEC